MLDFSGLSWGVGELMHVTAAHMCPAVALAPWQSVQAETRGGRSAPHGPAPSCNLLLLTPTWGVAPRSERYSQGSRWVGSVGTSPR